MSGDLGLYPESPAFPAPPPEGLTKTQWLICIMAAIGFAFDIYELLMAPLIIRPALIELSNGNLTPGSPDFAFWAGAMFYVPALAGGVFGLLGGYLTDRLGRRRVLTWSILLYAFSAFLAGFSTSLAMLLVLRCTTFIGVCVEFVAAVAWLAELFPEPRRREKVLGYTQAFSSLGGFLVAWVNGLTVAYASLLPAVEVPGWIGEIYNPHAPWRYTLMSGLIPAIPLIVIRPFLPESPVWRQKKLAGTLRRPSIAQLFSPQLRQTTIVTTIMVACAYGAAFGAIQQMPQMVPALPDVQKMVQARIAQAQAAAAPRGEAVNARAIASTVNQQVASDVAKVQELGGLVGRFLLAVLAIRIVSRRTLVRLFQVPGLVAMPVVFAFCAVEGLNPLYAGMFVAGLLTVGQFSFWGNYLPRVYPVHLRGTGESFAANIGGRMVGTSFAAVTQGLAVTFSPQNASPAQAAHVLAWTAAGVALFVYLVGFISSFFLPEPGLTGGEE